MKFLVLISSLIFTSSALALSLPVVKEVTQVERIQPACPMCEGGPLVTVTTIKFEYASCASMEGNFEVTLKEEAQGFAVDEAYKIVTISLKKQTMDCMGPTKVREYQVQTSELDKNTQYVLLNPTFLKANETTPTTTQTVQVSKPDNSMSCLHNGSSPEFMATQLKNIKILKMEKLHDGRIRPAVCGIETGLHNVYTINASDLSAAQELGFSLFVLSK